jgi:hypothetical protein
MRLDGLVCMSAWPRPRSRCSSARPPSGTAAWPTTSPPIPVVGGVVRHRLSRRRRHHEGRAEHQRSYHGRLDLGGGGDRHSAGCGLLCRTADGAAVHAVDVRAARSRSEVAGPRDAGGEPTFGPAGPPAFAELVQVAEARGYRVQKDSLRITFDDSRPVWRFCVVALDRDCAAAPALLAEELAASEGVASFSIVPVRN